MSLHKHFQTWRQHRQLQQQQQSHNTTLAQSQGAREYIQIYIRNRRRRRSPVPVWIEQLLRSFAQSKYFTNQALFWFCKCGLPISLSTHIHTLQSMCTHERKRKSLAMWPPLEIYIHTTHHTPRTQTNAHVTIKKAEKGGSCLCKSARAVLRVLTIFNWKIFIIYQFVCSTNNNNRSSTRTTRQATTKRKSHS